MRHFHKIHWFISLCGISESSVEIECVALKPMMSPQAAANEVQALSDVSALCAALRPPLPLDRELRGREEPPLVCALPAGGAAGAAVGAPHCLVSPTVTSSQPLLVPASSHHLPSSPSALDSTARPRGARGCTPTVCCWRWWLWWLCCRWWCCCSWAPTST